VEVVRWAGYEEKESEKLFATVAEFVLYPKNFLRWNEELGNEGVRMVIGSICKQKEEMVNKVGYGEL
jgi:hypothetical protein